MENNTKNVTLDSLRPEKKVYTDGETTKTAPTINSSSLGNAKEVEISEIAEYRKPERKDSVVDEALKEVDMAIAGLARRSTEFVKQRHEEEFEEELQKEIDGEEDTDEVSEYDTIEEDKLIDDDYDEEDDNEVELDIKPTNQETVTKKVVIPKEETDIVKEIEEEDEDVDVDSVAKNQLDNLRTTLKAKIRPVTDEIDLSAFTISKSPISVNTALKAAPKLRTFSWGLFESGLPLTLKEFKGYDISNLDMRNYNNRYKGYQKIYSIIYDHIVDEDKPKTLEQWLKLTSFYDIQHIYFGIYIASFKDSNYIPYTCSKCNEAFLTEDVPVMDMVKFKNDEIKKAAEEIISSEYNPENNKIEIERVQISNDYVIDFRTPSIYNIVFENASLEPEFTEKHANVLTTLTFIDCIYRINREKMTLDPIECQVYPNNIKKTYKTKIVKYEKILRTLNSDQLYTIDAIVAKIGETHENISYILPKAVCPKCGNVIEEVEVSSEELLFTRHPLMGIANS